MKKIFAFLKNRGFTLVEALVATIIAGYCMLPIMGTLQSGIERTQGFDHKEKLRLLARSRLNKELSVGAFDHTAIDTTTTYHYIYYNSDAEPKLLTIDTNLASGATEAGIALSPLATGTFLDPDYSSASSILYSYKVSVAVKENLKLGTSTANIKSDFVSGVSGLKAVTVMAELEPNDNVVATDSISLFSLLNIPSFSEDYIWISNPKNVEIIAIDPISRTRAESFLLPLDNNAKPREDSDNDTARPWNIAVHPSRKFIAIQCKHKIKALNIDRSSPAYGSCKEIWPVYTINGTDVGSTYAPKLADVNKDDKNKAVEDKGIVFRPDGKFCYVTAHQDMKIFSFVASNTENWENLALINKTEYLTNKEKNTVLHAGNDGYLYVGPKDANMALRFPMFAPAIFANPPQQITDASNKNILALDTTSDGQEFYILWADNIITRHSSATGAKIAQTVITPTPSGICSDIKLSGDGRYLGIIDAGSGADKGGFFLLNLSTNPIDNTNLSLTNAAIFKKADPNNLGKKEKIEYCIFVQQSNDFVFDEEKKPYMFAVDITGMNSNSYSSGIPDDRTINFASADKSQVAFVNRPVEYFVVGSNDGSLNYIEYVDLNLAAEINSTSRKPVDSLRIDLATTPVCIALTRSGEKMRVGYGFNRNGLDIFETFGARTRLNGSPHGGQWMHGVVTPNEFFDADPTAEKFVSMDHHPSMSWANGYWSDLPLPSTAPADYKSPNDVDFDTQWKCADIESLKGGGVLILFRNTSTNASMLEWIGKHQTGPISGKYERFARWYSTANDFPPHNARNMALSPDDRYLAIEAASSPNLLYIYDFNANNFGNLTQQRGLLIDYRQGNETPWTFANVMASCSFALNNPSNANGIKLRDSTTASETWPSIKTWPANYFYKIGASVTASTNNAKKAAANKRYVGYFRPESLTSMLAVSQLDHARLYLDLKPAAENSIDVRANLEYPASMSAFMQKPIQIDTCRANTTVRKISCGPGVVPGWEPDPITGGTTHTDTSIPVANTGNEPEALYQKHRWIEDGTLSYSFPDVPDGPAKVKLHFNDNYFDTTGQRQFHIDIEGVRKFSNFDIIHYAAASNTAVVISYDDIVVSSAGGAGLQIDLVNITPGLNNSLICGIEFTAAGDSYLGLYTSPTEGATAGAVASTSLTPTDRNNMNMPGWNRIASTSTMPFAFQPVFLRHYPLTGTSNTSSTGMTFSRDLANPILYVLEGSNDDLWCLKPGQPITRIDVPSMDIADKQLLVSNDNQRLIYGRVDAKELYIVDISDPNSFNFNGITRTPQSSLTGFGQVISTISTQGTPQVLANMPFNTIKSTPASGSYEFVATLSNTLSGVNNAAVASGGIYILGGSPLESGAAVNTIYCFNPLASYTANIAPMTATLTRRIFMHSTVAYDGELYTFNGSDSTGITDLVQKFNPTTGEVLAYTPPPVGGVTKSFTVSAKMSSSSSPYPYVVTHSGGVAQSSESGYAAFNGDTSYGWAATSAGQTVTYDFGPAVLAPVINRIIIHNNTSNQSYGVKQYDFEGYDGATWIPLITDDIVPKGSTNYSKNFSNTVPYRKYRLRIDSSHGGSYYCVREMYLVAANFRLISPSNMTGSSKDGKTVTTSNELSSEPGWKAFDGSTSSEWDTDVDITGAGEYIAMNLGTPDNINVVRILCQSGNDDSIKDFKFEYSTDGTTWVALPCLSGGTSTPRNPSNGVWNTFFFNNSNSYLHYRIFVMSSTGDEVEVKEIEFYSSNAVAAQEEQFFMTKTMTDNLAPVKVQENAACLTPYGIVIAGGRTNSSTATTTSLVYWPHGYHSFTSQSDYSLGISRSLPEMVNAVAEHCLVWHKGKLYRIGGANGGGTVLSGSNGGETFDFDTNQWSAIVGFPSQLCRSKAATCSFGDEIFVFGGEAPAGTTINTAYAWNPETTKIRQLPNVPKTTTYAMSAVACGPAIYLIGGSGSAVANNSATIIKYTP